MSLNYADKRLNNYFDALFVIGKMGNSRNELMTLQSFLSFTDFDEIKSFNNLHKDVVEIVSRDENVLLPSRDFAKIEEYEKIADNSNIAPRYKIKMYENVLIGIDKFVQSNTLSLTILNKIVNNLTAGDRDNLLRLQKISTRYKLGPKFLQDDLEKKINLKLKKKEPAAVDKALARYNEIKDTLKEPLSNSERIALLEEQLALVDKCAFKRTQKFQTKSAICYDLSNEYAGTKDLYKHDTYLNDSRYYARLVQNIKNHTR